jgi:penicillin-binding protein 1C
MMFGHRWRVGVALALLLVAILFTLDRLFPVPVPPASDGVVITAADGTPLRAYPTSDGVWRYRVTLQEVSPRYVEALLAYEDQYFFYHPGINPASLARAAVQWGRNGRIVSGGSTLTMQVARILDGPADRTVSAKLLQMARALQLEWHFSKQDILTLYLNHAPMGGIVEGVEMASRTYLGKSAKSLSVAEAAMLAALPQSPTKNRPDKEPKRAEATRNKVLDRMVTLGYLSAEAAADAKIERVVAQPIRGEWRAPLAAERIKGLYAKVSPGLVATTVNAELQSQVETLLSDRAGTLPPKVSMAVIVMENDSLAIRAYAGSADFTNAERFAHVDMARGVRSPGSTLKPFLYAMALDEGLIHSESLLVDAPQSFGGYAPGNFQASFSGAVSVAEALQRSLNVPAVDVLDRLGPARFASTMRRGGVRLRTESGASPNLSLILGGAGTTLEELVGAYRALAAGGVAGKPRLTMAEPKIESRLMSEGAAWIVREILETGGRPDRPFDDGGSRNGFAWKTGTSFGFRDAWAIGVTARYTVGVWMGRPDGTPNPGFFGANSAAPLARDIAAVLRDDGALSAARLGARPATVAARDICWPLGVVKEETDARHCHQVRRAWVLHDAAPPTLPDRARQASLREAVLVDAASGARVTPTCAAVTGRETRAIEIAHWPRLTAPWLPQAIAAQSSPPQWHAACAATASSSRAESIAIRGIDAGSVVRAPAGSKREVALRLSAEGAEGKVTWLLDGALVANAASDTPLKLVMAKNGQHELTAVDASGRFARVSFAARGF